MAESDKPVGLELGIEFVVEALLFLYPYGAEQMNLPHNFWLGLGCWIVGTIIAVRMFWIFPLWSSRLTKLEKGLIAFILVAGFAAIFYRPVMLAYSRRNVEGSRPETSSAQVQPQASPLVPPQGTVTESNGATATLKVDVHHAPKDSMTVEVKRKPHTAASDTRPGQQKAQRPMSPNSSQQPPPLTQDCGGGNCAASVGQQGGITAGQINIGPPPLKLEYSLHTLLSDEKAAFGFDRNKCPVVTHLRIVPNQSVPPPVRVALDFNYPVTQIATTIENVGSIMSGGPFTVGIHAISEPISPGIGPHNPLIVEVCSDIPVTMTGEPHLVN
jgi:hypothetical protein